MMKGKITRELLCALCLAVVVLLPSLARGQTTKSGLGAWQNPDIGFVYDLKWDLHDAERNENGDREWSTRGFGISSAELSVGADLDPYARLDFNAFFSESGAEIHELFFLFPALPLNLKAKGGQYLTNFGRWNQFHTHSMPFSSEPRILNEYFEGHLLLTGLELSWLLPVSRYMEIGGGVYNRMQGHTHDVLPAAGGSGWSQDNPPPGCHFHGDEIHCPDNPELEQEYMETVGDPDAPLRSKTNKGLEDFAYALRAKTSVDMGLSWSADIGVSGIHQQHYKHSQRIPGQTYSKTNYGADVTFFWTPPEANLYRNMDFGFEYFANDEEYEVVRDDTIYRQTRVRDGFFGYARMRVNRRWQFGAFGELFDSSTAVKKKRRRYGGFLTLNISHYQYVTLEVSRYERSPEDDPLHMIVLQYDGVIGYHTHGSQR
jgi:hypothetical protein